MDDKHSHNPNHFRICLLCHCLWHNVSHMQCIAWIGHFSYLHYLLDGFRNGKLGQFLGFGFLCDAIYANGLHNTNLWLFHFQTDEILDLSITTNSQRYFYWIAFWILKNDIAHCLKITQNVAFEFLNFGIFHQFLSYKKLTCLVTLFDRKLQVFKNSPKWTIFGLFD